MVAGNVGTFNSAGGAMDWFNQLPKVTRGYAALCVFTAACVSWKIPIIQYFFLDWTKVYGSFQVWRLFTHAGVIGALGFPLLFNVIWILTYGSTLESSVYLIHPEDYLFMYIFGASVLALISLLTGPLLNLVYITYSGHAMVMMLIYVWSREFPEQDISFYGVVKIKGFWLPFTLTGISVLMGQWALTLARKLEMPGTEAPQQSMPNPSSASFGPFRGRGMRLGGS